MGIVDDGTRSMMQARSLARSEIIRLGAAKSRRGSEVQHQRPVSTPNPL
jgi:hypothetical protein